MSQGLTKVLGEIDTKDIQNNNTDGNITLFIEKQETWYNGQYLNNNAHLGIANSEISVKLDANNDDKFSGLGWNTYSSYANSPINIGISYGFGPIDISYRSTEYDKSGNLSIPKTSSHIVKYMEIANNYPIEAVRDSHQVYYDIYQDGYHSGIHYITANLEYTIFFVNKHGKFENGKMTLRGGYH